MPWNDQPGCPERERSSAAARQTRMLILRAMTAEVRTCESRNLVTSPHVSRKYCSRYLGKSTANDDSSVNGPVDSVGRNGSIFHCSKGRAR
jgi:hypothetical protein